MARSEDDDSTLRWTRDQVLVWRVLQSEMSPREAERIANSPEMGPEIERALHDLTIKYLDAIYGTPSGMPVDKSRIARVLCGGRYVDLASLIQPPPLLGSGESSAVMHEYRAIIGQPTVEWYLSWVKRVSPTSALAVDAPVSGTNTEAPVAKPPPITGDTANEEAAPAPAPAGNETWIDPTIRYVIQASQSKGARRADDDQTCVQVPGETSPSEGHPADELKAGLAAAERALADYGIDLSAGCYPKLEAARRAIEVSTAAGAGDAKAPEPEPESDIRSENLPPAASDEGLSERPRDERGGVIAPSPPEPEPIPPIDAAAAEVSQSTTEMRSEAAKAPELGRAGPAEQLTYVQIAERRGGSPEAARAFVVRRGLPRTHGSDGKTLVTVNLQDHYPLPSARSPGGDRLIAGPETASPKPAEVIAEASQSTEAPEPDCAGPLDQLQTIVPFRSGAPGRPTAIDVVVAEGKRRIEAGEVTPRRRDLTKFAEELHLWWGTERKEHTPIGPLVGITTICNGLRKFWNSKLPLQTTPDR